MQKKGGNFGGCAESFVVELRGRLASIGVRVLARFNLVGDFGWRGDVLSRLEVLVYYNNLEATNCA